MEYITIWAITIGMTLSVYLGSALRNTDPCRRFDFVIGLLLGIILASMFFVIQNSRRKPIRAVFSGSSAKSTVRRPHPQRAFLQAVGKQTLIMKLQGFRKHLVASLGSRLRRTIQCSSVQSPR